MTKTCSRCGQTRPAEDFYPNRSTPCKPCARVSDKQRYASEPLDKRIARLSKQYIKRYGINYADYQALVVAQDGKCAICKREPSTIALAVDHDHETGKVRGLLCEFCNRAIGMLEDDAQRARDLAQYLERTEMPT